MNKSKSWFKTNLVYGLVVLVPLAILIISQWGIGSEKVLGELRL